MLLTDLSAMIFIKYLHNGGESIVIPWFFDTFGRVISTIYCDFWTYKWDENKVKSSTKIFQDNITMFIIIFYSYNYAQEKINQHVYIE